MAPEETPEDKTIRRMHYLETAAIPVGLAAGYQAAKVTTRRGNYKNVADSRHKIKLPDEKEVLVSGLLDELQNEHKVNKHTHLTNASRANSWTEKVGHWREYCGENKRYRQKLREFFKEMGFRNPLDHWRALHPNQQWDAFITGATATGILLGAVVLFSQNRQLAATLKKHERAREENVQNGPGH